MVSKNTVNYTPEMVEKLLSMYSELGNDGLEEIAQEFNKPIRSIRSKLCNEKVYVPTVKQKTTETLSKKEILRELEKEKFNTVGFENATKDALLRLLGFVLN